jgi:phenylacetate-CoA ligase
MAGAGSWSETRWSKSMLAERVYSHLPVAVQNLAVSLKGWGFHRYRYQSASFRNGVVQVKANEELPLEALRALQLEQARAFARFCYDRSPYYRRIWQAKGFQPEDLRRPEDLSLAPVVPKQDMRAHTDQFFTEKIHRSMVASHTSGTTGSPLTVYFSKEDMAQRMAFLERCRRWAGVHIGQRRASFTGRGIVPDQQRKPPFWRHNWPGNQLLFSAYHLTPENLSAYADAMARFKPQIIDGYPSAIHILAEHLLREGHVGLIKPQAILVSAETVLPHQRVAIEAAFTAKLYNQYASSDGAPFVSECSHGRLHDHIDSGIIEILKADGTRAAPGEVGEMVVTSFTTHVTPMFRFAMGDVAVAAPDNSRCECGYPFPILDSIVGRVDDILYTPDRGFVGRMDTAFKNLPNSVIEAQIVQVSPQTIVLKIVPDRSRYKPEHGVQLVKDLRARLGTVVEIQVEEATSIPRSANGKMRPVINLCTDLLPKSLRYSDAEIETQMSVSPNRQSR